MSAGRAELALRSFGGIAVVEEVVDVVAEGLEAEASEVAPAESSSRTEFVSKSEL